MKTAVIITGQARSFGETFPNIYDKVLRQLPNPEFFVSIADDEQAGTMTRLWERFPQDKVHIEYVQQPDVAEPPPEPKWLQMYPPSTHRQGILKQLWALNQGWTFFQGFKPDHQLIVRLRPDLAFMRFELPPALTDSQRDRLYIPFPKNCFTPWWARWGGVNDRVALLGTEAAQHYFTTLTKVPRLCADGCPLHPETIIDRSLRDGGIIPSHTLATEFAAIRLDGSIVAASITEIDTVEYARAK